jgi:hypothetical protein
MRGRSGASARQVFPKRSLHKGCKGRGYFLPAGVRLGSAFSSSWCRRRQARRSVSSYDAFLGAGIAARFL